MSHATHLPYNSILESSYRKPPNIRPGLIFVRKHFLKGLYIGAYTANSKKVVLPSSKP